MKHQRVTVAEQEQWTIRIRLDLSAAGFFAYVSNLNFFRARLCRIGRQQLRQIPGDLELLPFGCVGNLRRLHFQFFLNYYCYALRRDNVNVTETVAGGLTKSL